MSDTETIIKERAEARARLELIKPHKNNPVAEFFSSPNTPQTDAQINGKPCTRFAIAAGDSLRDALVPSEFARKLERERDEARAERDLYKRMWDESRMETVEGVE